MKKRKLKKLRKFPTYLIGLFQALGVAVYCLLLAGFFNSMEKLAVAPPQFLAIAMMLTIFVFSAAVCGTLVFGYPTFLALSKKRWFSEALAVVLYTLLYLVILICITVFIISIY